MKKIKFDNIKLGVKILNRYLSPHKKQIILIWFLSCVSALSNGFIPYITGKLLDSILAPQTTTLFYFTLQSYFILLVAWIIVQIIAYSIDWKNGYEADKLAAIVWSEYIAYGMSHVLRLPIPFHKKTKSGQIGSKIQKTAGAFYNLSKTIVDVIPQFLTIIIATILLATINLPLLGILLIGLCLYIAILFKIVPQGGKLQREIYETWNKAWANTWDAINNITTVKQASTEDYEKKKIYKGFFGKAFIVDLQLVNLWNNLGFYQRVIILVTQLAVFFFSIIYIQKGLMTIGELVAFNAYAGMFFGPFVILGRRWQDFQNGIIFALEAEKILSLPTESYDNTDSVSKAVSGSVNFKNVDYYYEKSKPVLKDISFEVKPGEVVALVGRSGEGKTTLIDLLSNYHSAKVGKILIDGTDIKKFSLKSLRSQIAVVPQEVVLFNDTIKKNVQYGSFDATDKQIEEAARKAHALEFIEKFPKKWKQVVGERGVKLSVGQKQRVAIARAILRNPKILILDEPTSALDAESESFITKSLEDLMQGRTTFIIAHRLSTVRRADKILVFKEGTIVEQGKHDELINLPNGVYRHLYELQIGLHQ